MAAKTLSTSTLSLKFMQNAHRAKHLAEVQLERAEVKDDGEWEVAKEIRDAWGPETTQSVSYEASYLPFLFTSDASSSDSGVPPATNLKGRRAFKRGREVADEYQAIVPAAPATDSKPSIASTSKSAGKQPKQISGRTGSNTNSNSKKNASAPKGKSARQAIYDNSGVGADLRSHKVDPAQNNQSAPNIFLKPAGVDEPAESTKAAASQNNQSAPVSLSNIFLKPAGVDEPAESTNAMSADAPTRPGKSKGKRELEQAVENAETESGPSKKRKKKKKHNDQAAATVE
ncbi:hypothetical protein DFH08DRAFT_902720 [Mycena albidolilacea]|uniref:Uncharacterized protein n=1 Tax=Mycena albidolilacea TaxID=1033008 RepID=A0AAD6Z2X4_9AGAR|nr:hypothetical protein DFH08DRAFT_902720 [Mycena albidolilacea]